MMQAGGIQLVALIAALAFPAAPAAATRATGGSPQLIAMEGFVNTTRAQHGLRALHVSYVLDRSALLKAGAIRRCQSFSHTPCGSSFLRTFQSVGYTPPPARVGENLFWGSGNLGSPASAINGWLKSPPHRANLLARGWRDMGVAAVYAPSLFGASGVWLYVLQFGRR
jgi:uncharacterized protein YkwD